METTKEFCYRDNFTYSLHCWHLVQLEGLEYHHSKWLRKLYNDIIFLYMPIIDLEITLSLWAYSQGNTQQEKGFCREYCLFPIEVPMYDDEFRIELASKIDGPSAMNAYYLIGD